MQPDGLDGKAIDERTRDGLKDFQRKTVDYVFRRMYEDSPHTTRFLVADEVGLGKTLVARGLIARVIRHLQEMGTDRIDIVYICSNADIAAQNIRRLNVTGDAGLPLATRITLLPKVLHQIAKRGVNFVSFTPGTSFNLKSQSGIGEERAVIFRLLEYTLNESLDRPGAYRVLRAGMREENFRSLVYWTKGVTDDGEGLDETLSNAFRCELHQHPELLDRFVYLMERGEVDPNRDDWRERWELIGYLRKTLARGCVEALQPDLVILDEFQRFRDLLQEPDPDNIDDIRHLSHHMFQQQDVRTLLLSATPYKMYTLHDEDEDDHYADFLKTASFLMGGDEIAAFAEDLRAFRRSMLEIDVIGMDVLIRRKNAVERRLKGVMSRTERIAVSDDKSGMFRDRELTETRLEVRDVRAYASVDRLSRALGAGDVLDYWKSSPYLLNFMDSYKLKREFRKSLEPEGVAPAHIADLNESTLLNYNDITDYEEVDLGNARLRGLAASTVGIGAGEVLWLPPSLPYYRSRGAYANPAIDSLTKRLVFSSWNVVPDVISSLLSYEVERAMMKSRNINARNTSEDRARLRGLLSVRRQDGDPAGMSTFAFLYPSVTLAEYVDPFVIARNLGAANRLVGSGEVLQEATYIVERLVTPLIRRAPESGPEDQRWYWAIPLLLDHRRWPRQVTEDWLASSNAVRNPGSAEDSGEDDTGAWIDHVELARSVLREGPALLSLGRVPADLFETMAKLALGAPGNCALRSIKRVLGSEGNEREVLADVGARNAAFRVAWGFRTLYNIPEVMSSLRGLIDEADTTYWQRACEEGFNGNLQAVLDEYVHLLPEWLGIVDREFGTSAHQVAELIHDTVAIRAANYRSDRIDITEGQAKITSAPFRVRFALRFGRDVTDDQQVLQRSSAVRAAFNSPFWPFVLSSTSVGQEGLDFHQYCHAVVHWNLPANPVDLEQREGRVHRYKGHAIRKNVAQRHREAAFKRGVKDPWRAMFAEAVFQSTKKRPKDIEPFWIYDGPAQIERHVPLLPLSREVEQLYQLRRSLAAYRLVFGQPRQEDLIAYLQDIVSPEELANLVNRLRIDLTPL